MRDLHNFLNNNVEHLSFTMEMSPNKMNFLDLWIIKGEEGLYTDLYTKQTDRNTLLKADSYHPLFLKNSLPYSQFCRVRRICKNDMDFTQNLKKTQQKFRMRGYDEKCIEDATKKIVSKNRSDFFKPRVKIDKNSILFITKYIKTSEKLKHIIKNHWHILQKDDAIKHLYRDPPKLVFKRGRNLRNELVKSEYAPSMISPSQTLLAPIPDGNYKCGACAQCNSTSKTTYFNHPQTGKRIKIKGIISCTTKGVIYKLTCPCGKAYIGKTSRELKQRIAEHRSTIRCRNINYPVAQHFIEFNHPISSLKYTGIERIEQPKRGGNWDTMLLRREAFWISTLGTLSPQGLNEELDLRPFI